MIQSPHTFTCRAKIFLYPGMAGWHFFPVDKKVSASIKKARGDAPRRGWGSIPVWVTIGKTKWKTSIFPDKDGTYLLPLKAEVRKKAELVAGDTVSISIRFA